MNLTRLLRKDGFDLIDGSVRNHKLLQIWKVKATDSLQLYADHIDKIFDGRTYLNADPEPSLVLPIDSTKVDTYNFRTGLFMLNPLLKALNLGKLDVRGSVTKARRVNISFDQTDLLEINPEEVDSYIYDADVRRDLYLKDLNRNNYIVITGLMRARKLVVEIESKTENAIELNAEIKDAIDGNIQFNSSGDRKIRMEHEGEPFPVAVKAHRIHFDKGQFVNTVLVTDSLINKISF
jgi:hypothetical protein